MSNACVLEFLEIIQRGLAEGSLAVAEFGIFVFEINGFRFVELVIEKVTVGEIGFDHHCVIRREFQSFEGSCDRLTGFPIEELIPPEVQVVTSVIRLKFNSPLYILDR